MTSFNINRPKRLTFNQWVELAQQLSGQKDVSTHDMLHGKDDMLHRMEQTLLAKDPVRERALFKHIHESDQFSAENAHKAFASFADDYQRAEAADGRHREDHPNDETDC